MDHPANELQCYKSHPSGYGFDHLPPNTIEIKNKWSLTSTLRMYSLHNAEGIQAAPLLHKRTHADLPNSLLRQMYINSLLTFKITQYFSFFDVVMVGLAWVKGH